MIAWLRQRPHPSPRWLIILSALMGSISGIRTARRIERLEKRVDELQMRDALRSRVARDPVQYPNPKDES